MKDKKYKMTIIFQDALKKRRKKKEKIMVVCVYNCVFLTALLQALL